MSIEKILDLRLELIPDSADDAMRILSEEWDRASCPTEREELIRVLKRTLNRCNREYVTYPRVFLLRKCELARNEFQPFTGLDGPTLAKRKFPAPSHPAIKAEWCEAATKDFTEGLKQPLPPLKRTES